MRPHFLSLLFLLISISAVRAADGVANATPVPGQPSQTLQPGRARRVQPSPQQNAGKVRPGGSPILLHRGNGNRLQNNRGAIEQGMVRPKVASPTAQRPKPE